jgi:hypothetical protein
MGDIWHQSHLGFLPNTTNNRWSGKLGELCENGTRQYGQITQVPLMTERVVLRYFS